MAESQKYRIVGKYIYRASTQDITMGTRQDGSPNVVRQPGPMEKLEVGAILDDVTTNELAAYGDRLELVTAEDDRAMQTTLEETGMPASAFNTEKGVHEPTGTLGWPGQKPPPPGDEVEALKAGQAEVRKVEKEQAEKRAQLDKEMQEARDKAMSETVARTYQTRQQRGQGPGSPESAPPPSAAPASTAPASTPATPAPVTDEGPAARRPRG